MEPYEIALIGVALFAYTLISQRIETTPFTMPMVFVAVGAASSIGGIVDVAAERDAIRLLAEVTLAVILFSDATRISLGRLRHQLAIPARLLGIGLPLTVATGTLVLAFVFPQRPLAEALLVAAVLSPTDAALGSAVIEDPSVPARDRLALNVESGINDGLVVPVVTVATSIVLESGRSTSYWLGFVAQQIGLGVLMGLAIGSAGISLLGWSRRAKASDGRFEQIATFVLPVVALCGADAIDGNGFIAAFVGGLTFGAGGLAFGAGGLRRATRREDADPGSLTEFTEDAAQLLAVVAFFVFGNIFVGDNVGSFGPRVLVAALAMLTVVRMLPVAVSLIGSGLELPTRLFLGWFGPRGLASIVFGILLLEEFEAVERAADELFGIVTITVTVSVFLHGATAASGARRYGQWAETAAASIEDPDRMRTVNLAADAAMPRSRWERRR